MNAFIEHHQQSIRFAYSCFDRILLNGVIQILQSPACVVGFLKEKRQAARVTPAYFKAISTDYHHFVQAFAEQRHVEILVPPKGVRREEWVEPFYERLLAEVFSGAGVPMFETAELGHKIDKETYLQDAPNVRADLLAAQ
jgi:hypothetical protein